MSAACDTSAAAMTDAAVGTAAPAAAAAAFHCSQLPTGQTLHSLYLRGLTDAQVQTIKNQASAGQMDFAILNADRLVSLFQLECAGVKSSLQSIRNKLKTKNIHSEFTFNLGYTGHFQTSIDFLSAKATREPSSKSYNVVVCVLHASADKLARLNDLVAPYLSSSTNFDQMRAACDEQIIIKQYKISDSELQPALPSAVADDALLRAVIGRISVKI